MIMRSAGLAIVGSLAFAGAALAAEWERFRAAGDGFSVEFPGAPMDRENNLDPDNLLRAHDYGVEVGTGILMVTVFAFRPEVRARISDEAIFRYAIDTYVGACEGRNDETSEPIKAGVGRTVLRTCLDGTTFKTVYHLLGDKLYRLIGGGAPGLEDGPDGKRFFGSFEVLGTE